MKNHWILSYAAALSALFLAAVCGAQDTPLLPASAVRVNISSGSFVQDAADPADAPAAAPGEDMVDAMDEAADEGDAAAEEAQEAGGPVRLFNTCGCVDIYGHVSFGFYDNGDGDSRGFGNQPLGFRNVSDSPTMDQFWLTAEKGLDTDCCCWDWGFRIDYVFGADGPDTTAFGDQSAFDYRWQSSRDYGSAVPQLYAQFGKDNFNVKVGHFYTIIGYEVVAAPDNFFYSHAYTMYYAEPFTHTGFLSETNLMCDQLTVWAGWSNGWDSYFGNYLHGSTFLGGASYAPNDCLTATYAVTFGDYGDGTARKGEPSNDGDIYMHSIVIDYVIDDCNEYVFQSDYGKNTGLPGENVEWYGVNQYLFHTLSSCYKVGMRFEWFKDADGARISNANGTPIGNNVDYYALTLGLNYTPNDNVIIRPEVRYDWADGGNPFNPNGAGVGQDDDQFYYGMDMIVLF